MSGKLKLKGHLKHLARWPLYLSVLLIALNFLVYVINIKAGVVVTMGIVLYLGTAIGLLFYHRPLMFNDLIAFASQYEFLEKRVLEELALPYAVPGPEIDTALPHSSRGRGGCGQVAGRYPAPHRSPL